MSETGASDAPASAPLPSSGVAGGGTSAPASASLPPASAAAAAAAASAAAAAASAAASADNVRVALRVRPLITTELSEQCDECLYCVPNEPQVVIGKDRAFTFDHVFAPSVSQRSVFETCAVPLVESILRGYNATMLAYGQTGSGKTFTMGSGAPKGVREEDVGIIPRVLEELFSRLSELPGGLDAKVQASFVEIYNEEINDLLSATPNSAVLPIESRPAVRDDGLGGVTLSSVTEVQVRSKSDAMRVLEKGSASRATGATMMNDQSSRSHAVFTLSVERASDEEGVLSSKFHFVDLAGSERVKRTKATGERFREGVNINSGLLALGNVISALADEKKRAAHVPYRDSKLTRLLQDSLGGNSRTLMIACVSPADVNFEETLNTLKYADRAKAIKNKPVLNRSADSPETSALRRQVEMLKLEIIQARRLAPDGGGLGEAEAKIEQLRLRNEQLQQQLAASESEVARMRAAQAVLERRLAEAYGGNVPADVQSEMKRLAAEDTSASMIQSQQTRIDQLEREVTALRGQLHDARVQQSVSYDAIASRLAAATNATDGGAIDDGTLPSSLLAAVEADVRELEPADVNELYQRTLDTLAKQAELEAETERGQAELDSLENDIGAKERLLNEIMASRQKLLQMRADYETQVHDLQSHIQALEAERDRALRDARTQNSSNEEVKRVRDKYEARLKQLQKELAQKKQQQTEYQQLRAQLEQREKRFQTLQEEIVSLKKHRVSLLRQQKEERKAREAEIAAQRKELERLRRVERESEQRILRLQQQQQQQQAPASQPPASVQSQVPGVPRPRTVASTAASVVGGADGGAGRRSSAAPGGPRPSMSPLRRARSPEAAAGAPTGARPPSRSNAAGASAGGAASAAAAAAAASGAPANSAVAAQLAAQYKGDKRAWLSNSVVRAAERREAGDKYDELLHERDQKHRELVRCSKRRDKLAAQLAESGGADSSSDASLELADVTDRMDSLEEELKFLKGRIQEAQKERVRADQRTLDMQALAESLGARDLRPLLVIAFEECAGWCYWHRQREHRISVLQTELKELRRKLEAVEQTRRATALRATELERDMETRELFWLEQVNYVNSLPPGDERASQAMEMLKRRAEVAQSTLAEEQRLRREENERLQHRIDELQSLLRQKRLNDQQQQQQQQQLQGAPPPPQQHPAAQQGGAGAGGSYASRMARQIGSSSSVLSAPSQQQQQQQQQPQPSQGSSSTQSVPPSAAGASAGGESSEPPRMAAVGTGVVGTHVRPQSSYAAAREARKIAAASAALAAAAAASAATPGSSGVPAMPPRSHSVSASVGNSGAGSNSSAGVATASTSLASLISGANAIVGTGVGERKPRVRAPSASYAAAGAAIAAATLAGSGVSGRTSVLAHASAADNGTPIVSVDLEGSPGAGATGPAARYHGVGGGGGGGGGGGAPVSVVGRSVSGSRVAGGTAEGNAPGAADIAGNASGAVGYARATHSRGAGGSAMAASALAGAARLPPLPLERASAASATASVGAVDERAAGDAVDLARVRALTDRSGSRGAASEAVGVGLPRESSVAGLLDLQQERQLLLQHAQASSEADAAEEAMMLELQAQAQAQAQSSGALTERSARAAGSNVFDRLTDRSSYTGIHKRSTFGKDGVTGDVAAAGSAAAPPVPRPEPGDLMPTAANRTTVSPTGAGAGGTGAGAGASVGALASPSDASAAGTDASAPQRRVLSSEVMQRLLEPTAAASARQRSLRRPDSATGTPASAPFVAGAPTSAGAGGVTGGAGAGGSVSSPVAGSSASLQLVVPVHLGTAHGHSGQVLSLASLTDGRFASGSADYLVKIWDPDAGCQEVVSLSGHAAFVRSMAYTSNAGLLCSGAREIKLWDVRRNECVQTLSSQQTDAYAMLVHDDALISGHEDGSLRVYSLRMMKLLSHIANHHSSGVFSLAHAGNKLFSGARDHTVKACDIRSVQEAGVEQARGRVTLQPVFTDAVQALCVAGQSLFCGSRDSTIMAWDVDDTSHYLGQRRVHTDWVQALACSYGGGTVYSGDRQGWIVLWDAARCVATGSFGVASSTNALLSMPSMLVAGLGDRTVKLWKV